MAFGLISLAGQAGNALGRRFKKNTKYDPTDNIPRFINAGAEALKASSPSFRPQIQAAQEVYNGVNTGLKALFPDNKQTTQPQLVIPQPKQAAKTQPSINQGAGGQQPQYQPNGDNLELITPPVDGFDQNQEQFRTDIPLPDIQSGQSNASLSSLAKQVAEAGGGIDDFLSLARGIEGSSTNQDDIRNELGIPDLIDEVFKQPTQTAQSLYQNAFEEAGLPQLKERIVGIDSEISKARDQLNEAVGEELNNPFISAASRSARIRNAQTLAENKISNLENQRTSLAGLYNQGLDQVEGLVSGVLQQSENDRLRSAEQLNFLLDEADRKSNLAASEQDRELFRFVPEFLQRQSEISSEPSTIDLLKLEEQRLKNQKARAELNTDSGKQLTESNVRLLSDAKNLPNVIAELDSLIKDNEGVFGPVQGTLRQKNPYDRTAQTVEAQIRSARQLVGKFMEGGVLRKEDEEKYRKILPDLSDTPEVAKAKVGQLRDLLANQYSGYIKDLQGSGYSTSAFPNSLFGGESLDDAFDSIQGFSQDLSRSQNGSSLGELSAKFESNGSPAAIGYDSTGGYSYGTYQLAHNNAKNFVDNSSFSGFFKGMKFNSKEYRDTWKKVAASYPQQFEAEQKDYIKRTHFDPQVNKLAKAGYDINWFSDTIKDVVWSTAVQHGGNTDIIVKALKGLGNQFKESDLVKAIYNERWSNGRRFASSTKNVRNAVYNRFFGKNGEQNLALSRLT